jgi:hypothetical protein
MFLVPHVSAQEHSFSIPQNAHKLNETLYSLGEKRDPQSGKLVEGYLIIEKGNAYGARSGGSAKAPRRTACYSFLASGAKWKGTPEPWVMNPSNRRGLDGTALFNILGSSIQTWETAAGWQILGDGTQISSPLIAEQSGSPDGANEVYFADIDGTSTIGVTIVWGIFGGPVLNRQLTEWDQIYDDGTFDWSAGTTGVAGKMDFRSIATHELGHAAGLGDLYNSQCSLETMYGYASTGDTSKQDLNTGDVTGINELY